MVACLLKSLPLPLKVMVPLDFHVAISAFFSFSSPPKALIALSRTAFGVGSSARAGLTSVDTRIVASKRCMSRLTGERKTPGADDPHPGTSYRDRGAILLSYARRGLSNRG